MESSSVAKIFPENICFPVQTFWQLLNSDSDCWPPNIDKFYNDGSCSACSSHLLNGIKVGREFWGRLLGHESGGYLKPCHVQTSSQGWICYTKASSKIVHRISEYIDFMLKTIVKVGFDIKSIFKDIFEGISMENKQEALISKQEPNLLDLCGMDLAKELANIPFYFCEVSPDMEFIPCPKKRRIQPPTTPPSTPSPLDGDNGIDEELKKSPISVKSDHKPSPQQLHSAITCNVKKNQSSGIYLLIV